MPAPEPNVVRLLDVEPQLAWRLREDDRAEARERVTLRATVIPEGGSSLTGDDPRTHPVGLVVVDGVLLQDVQLAGRHSLQLLGRGDVVLPRRSPLASLDVAMTWTAATETCVAVLDDRLQAPLATWPGLGLGLLDRVAQQIARLSVQAAIAQLPRVEDRLEATFWELAERLGRRTPSGIHLPLHLTHEVLARLVGGRRPTISLALTTLAERGTVTRHPDGSWLVVAERPSLPPHDQDGAPPPVGLTDAAEAPAEHEPWQSVAREELLASTRRLRAEHEAAVRRVTAGRLRYAETRERSEWLRREAALARERRWAELARREAAEEPAFTQRRPAAPSGG